MIGAEDEGVRVDQEDASLITSVVRTFGDVTGGLWLRVGDSYGFRAGGFFLWGQEKSLSAPEVLAWSFALLDGLGSPSPTLCRAYRLVQSNVMLNVGLVGFGFAGRVFHAPVIRAVQGLKLTTIVRPSGTAVPYADTVVVRSVDELLARDIDLVVVATPNTSHHPIAKQCLLAGKHVVIDKPFTVTHAEAEDLIALGRQKQRVITAYQNRRYVGDFFTLRRLLDGEALGRVVSFESHFDRFRPERKKERAWREDPLPGSGVWFDLGAHLLDQALVLFGLPEAISADIRIERERVEVNDAFDVMLHYPRMRAMLRATVLAAAPGAMFTVHGTKGSFVKFGLDPQEAALIAGHTPDEPHWDEEPPELFGKLTTADATTFIPTTPSSFTHYYENVRDAILGKSQVEVTPEQILNNMRGLELAVESSNRRCAVNWRG
jgi:scyllo-inositol 2-dehydrogenase (NADP+)